MGAHTVSPQSRDVPTTASYLALNVKEDESFEALPGIHLINRAVNALKEPINNGERGCSCSKAGAYLGFRLITYSGLPLVLNLISTLVSALLCLVTLPIALCDDTALRWSWTHLQGSLGYTTQSLYDLTCDFRQLTGKCCCDPESTYLMV